MNEIIDYLHFPIQLLQLLRFKPDLVYHQDFDNNLVYIVNGVLPQEQLKKYDKVSEILSETEQFLKTRDELKTLIQQIQTLAKKLRSESLTKPQFEELFGGIFDEDEIKEKVDNDNLVIGYAGAYPPLLFSELLKTYLAYIKFLDDLINQSATWDLSNTENLKTNSGAVSALPAAVEDNIKVTASHINRQISNLRDTKIFKVAFDVHDKTKLKPIVDLLNKEFTSKLNVSVLSSFLTNKKPIRKINWINESIESLRHFIGELPSKRTGYKASVEEIFFHQGEPFKLDKKGSGQKIKIEKKERIKTIITLIENLEKPS